MEKRKRHDGFSWREVAVDAEVEEDEEGAQQTTNKAGLEVSKVSLHPPSAAAAVPTGRR